jgi:hypothetical protein
MDIGQVTFLLDIRIPQKTAPKDVTSWVLTVTHSTMKERHATCIDAPEVSTSATIQRRFLPLGSVQVIGTGLTTFLIS